MAKKVAQPKNIGDVRALVRQLHMLVVRGPWDLEVADAMSSYGYDEVKWAEGQMVLAELVSSDRPGDSSLDAANLWYDEAAAWRDRGQPGVVLEFPPSVTPGAFLFPRKHLSREPQRRDQGSYVQLKLWSYLFWFGAPKTTARS
jgi:hypothetical protein